MGCTQSRAVADEVVTYPKMDVPHPLESTKSSNTARSTTSNSSTDSSMMGSNPIISASTFDFEYEIPVIFEMTTEDDPTMVQAIVRMEDRLVMDSPVKKRKHSPSNHFNDEEFLTDDFYEEVPNMDDYLNPPPECSTLMVPKRSQYMIIDADGASHPSEEDVSYQRSMSVHQEQQKRLSLVHMLLPWTHAIVVRKQRDIASRQVMRSSFVWFSMLLWPRTMARKRTTIRSYNPTCLFRR